MRYTVEMEIDADLDLVWQKFTDPDFLKNWQPKLKGHDHLEGEVGMPGAKAKLVYEGKKGRDMEILEEITHREDRTSMHFRYLCDGVVNEVENTFEEDDGKTVWRAHHVFEFPGFIMKTLQGVVRPAFRKQTISDMRHFKAAVESAKN